MGTLHKCSFCNRRVKAPCASELQSEICLDELDKVKVEEEARRSVSTTLPPYPIWLLAPVKDFMSRVGNAALIPRMVHGLTPTWRKNLNAEALRRHQLMLKLTKAQEIHDELSQYE